MWGVSSKRLRATEEERLLRPVFGLELYHQLLVGAQAAGLPCRCWACQPPRWHSQSLKINLSTYMHHITTFWGMTDCVHVWSHKIIMELENSCHLGTL